MYKHETKMHYVGSFSNSQCSVSVCNRNPVSLLSNLKQLQSAFTLAPSAGHSGHWTSVVVLGEICRTLLPVFNLLRSCRQSSRLLGTFCWMDEAKMERLNEQSPVWRKENAAFRPKILIPSVKHDGGSIMVRARFAASWLWWLSVCFPLK